MIDYVEVLKSLSVNSIYILFIFVLFFLIVKGRIKEKELILLFYIYVPLAVITQITMSYIREIKHLSNLPVMNVYLIIDFIIMVYTLLKIRNKVKGIELNYKLWGTIVLLGVLSHFIYDFNSLHSISFLIMSLTYFQLTVNFIDIDNIKKFLFNHYTFIYIAVFFKAIGYSYFLIYQTDYRFPLTVYSVVNILVQLFFVFALVYYYKDRKNQIIN